MTYTTCLERMDNFIEEIMLTHKDDDYLGFDEFNKLVDEVIEDTKKELNYYYNHPEEDEF